MSVREVLHAVKRLRQRTVVITGGEPLLQGSPLTTLAAKLASHGIRIEVETNATIAPTEKLRTVVHQWNVSPKLLNSGLQREAREVPEVLRAFAKNPRAWFKFVICQSSDVHEVDRIADEYRIPPGRIYLMPEGTTAAVVRERFEMLRGLQAAHKYHLTTRLHILLWGNTPGR